MRILIVHNAYAQPGGEDAVVRAEAEGLRARGHDVQLCLRDSAALHASPLRGAAETLLTVSNPAAARELTRAVQSFSPDVVHMHNLFPRWGLSALRALAACGVKVVQTLHNYRWLCAPATLLLNGRDCTRCIEGNFLSAVRFGCQKNRAVSAAYALALATNRKEQLAERVVARFICVSERVRALHVQAGFEARKLVVKGHFVDAAPGAAGPGDGAVLYAGRLSEEKGVAVLLRALHRLPGVTLKIAGDGPERVQLEAELGALRARVHFLGRLSRDELRAEQQRSSVCVVPSTGSETFGLAALEAFACGRPVVASDAGGLPELVRDGENGWIVPRGDEHALAARLQWLLHHPEAALQMGRAGHALVQRDHLRDSNLRQLERIYDQALGAA